MDDGWTEGLINRQMDKVTHRCKDRQTNGPMELQIKGGTDGETGRQNEGFQNILYKLSIIIIYKYLILSYFTIMSQPIKVDFVVRLGQG